MTDQVPDVPGGPHLRTAAMPRDTNASGVMFGGWTSSEMEFAGRTSVAVRIETSARDRASSAPEKVTGGMFTYVALDENGEPREPDRNDAGT